MITLSTRRATLLMTLAFVAVSTVTTVRTARNVIVPGEPHLPRYGLQDFRDVIYYPSVALLEGRNPYDAATFTTTYPVAGSYAPYTPIALLLYLPFALLSPVTAEWLHYGLNTALLLALAWLSLRLCGLARSPARVLGLAALFMMSRPGHMTLYIGQSAVYFVLATYLALGFATTRPWLSGLGFAITCAKPTFAVPLGLLMLCRLEVRAVASGAAMAALAGGATGLVLVHIVGGIEPLIESIRGAYTDLFQDPSATAISSTIRLDAAALLTHLVGRPLGRVEDLMSLVILALGGISVARLARHPTDSTRLASSCLICSTILACTYHQAYDGLLLALPATALASGRFPVPNGARGPALLWLLVGLVSVPAVNYLATDTTINLLRPGPAAWRAIVSLNSAAVLAAFVLQIVLACQGSRSREVPPTPLS